MARSRPTSTTAQRVATPTALVLLWVAAVSGCTFPVLKQGKSAKYQTVAASTQHDTGKAKEKHAEALVLLECHNSPKKLAKAENLLNDALVADVTYGPAHNSLGMLYYLQNKLYLAAWEFEYAAKLMPEHAEPYNNLGLVYEQAGKYDEAISYFSMALNHRPDDPKVMGNLVRTRLASGDEGSDLTTMVSDLALHHPDPVWQQWARDQIGLKRFNKDGLDLKGPNLQPAEEIKALPLPIPEEVFPPPALEFPSSALPAGA